MDKTMFGRIGGPIVREVLYGKRDRQNLIRALVQRGIDRPAVVARRVGRLLGGGYLEAPLRIVSNLADENRSDLPQRHACIQIQLQLNELRSDATGDGADLLRPIAEVFTSYLDSQWPEPETPGLGITGLRSMRGAFEGIQFDVLFRDHSDLTQFIDRCLKFIPGISSVGLSIVEDDYFSL